MNKTLLALIAASVLGLPAALRAAPAAAKAAAQPAVVAQPAAAAQPSEVSYVVKIQDMNRECSYEAMNGDELKTLQKTIQLETRYFQEAVQAAAKQWREDEANKTVPFSGTRLAPRQIVGTPERFENREKADKQLNLYLEREQKKQERELTKKKGKKPAPRGKGPLTKEQEREANLERAAEMVKARLDEIVAAKSGGAGAAGAQPDAGGAKPAEAKDALKKAL